MSSSPSLSSSSFDPENHNSTSGGDLKPDDVIAIDGATGYLGNHLVAGLRGAGYQVKALVHPGARQKDLEFLRECGAQVVSVSLEKADSALQNALSGCKVAVHLIGSIAPRKGERLEDLHGSQTRNLAESCKAAGVSKIVQVTTLGSSATATNSYQATKWQAEEFVRSSGCKFVILRPSLIIGKQAGNRDSKLVMRYFDLIRKRPAVPVIGGGTNRIQPVFIGDLVGALTRAICTSRFDSGVYEIGGGEVLTMRQFVEKLIALSGASKQIRTVPLFAAGIAAAFCESFQDVPLVTRDQIKLSSEDNICRDNALSKVFGVHPTSVDAALKTYVENAANNGTSLAGASTAGAYNAPLQK